MRVDPAHQRREYGHTMLETLESRARDPEFDRLVLPEDVEWADLSQDQRWHYKNVEWNTERTLQRRAELRAWVNDRKAKRGCADCGESDPTSLNLHHRGDADKEMEITEMVTHGYARENLRAEMEKCVVLCANCHRREHFEPPESYRDDPTPAGDEPV